MNKTELIAAAAQQAGLSKKDMENALNAALDVITAALADGEKVQLVGFGSFEVKKRVTANGRPVKASYDVKEGDVLELRFGERSVKVQVLNVSEHVGKADAPAMYQELS